MEDRFKTLRLLGSIYKVVAWLGVLGGLIVFFMLWAPSAPEPAIAEPGSFHQATSSMSLPQGMALLIGTALHFIVFLGLSQAIEVMLEVLDRSLKAASSAGEAVSALGSVDVRLEKISRMLSEKA